MGAGAWTLRSWVVSYSARSMLGGLLQAMRLHQWVKNLFVLAPALFARVLLEPPVLLRVALATLAFGFASSAVYLFNDIADLEADRAHPVKRHRPIASGRVPVILARRAAMALVALALGGGALLGGAVFACLAGYLLLNGLYSRWTKRIAYLDVLSIALGFELRVLAGAAAAQVPPSGYLLGVTLLLASFLGFGKRMHELQALGSQGGRSVLRRYHEGTLRVLLWGTAAATVALYLVYTLDPRTHEVLGTRHFVWTVPFAAVGVVRFVRLVQRRGSAESPTEAMLRDGFFVANLVLWGVVVGLLLYGCWAGIELGGSAP